MRVRQQRRQRSKDEGLDVEVERCDVQPLMAVEELMVGWSSMDGEVLELLDKHPINPLDRNGSWLGGLGGLELECLHVRLGRDSDGW